MFALGEKIVYPLYGAGIIEALKEKMVDGKNEVYYVIRLPIGNLKIELSSSKALGLGIRKVNSPQDVMKIIKSISKEPSVMSTNWNQRYKDNLEKIKSGNLHEVCEVYRNLALRENERGLSNAEKKLLNNAKQILISEVVLTHNIEKEEAETAVKKTLFSI